SPNHLYRQDFNGETRSVAVKVFSDDGRTATATVSLAVFNVAPTLKVTFPKSVTKNTWLVGASFDVTVQAWDAGLDDELTVTPNWGDGHLQPAVKIKNGGSVTLSNTLNSTGIWDVGIEAFDGVASTSKHSIITTVTLLEGLKIAGTVADLAVSTAKVS